MPKLRALLGPLRVFDTVSRAHGVSRAAELLHVTPGAVSQQLKQLETALGVELFQKKGRELEPTDAGRKLALRMADLFNRVEDAVREASASSKARGLRLKVMPTFAIKWLVPRLAGFYAQHGHIDIEIATVQHADDVQLDDADFVVRNGVGQWADVLFDHLFDDEFVPVCTPQMASEFRTAHDLLNANLLHSMMRPDTWDFWLKSAGLSDGTSKRGVTLSNAALCYQAAADGLGVAIAQKAYIADDLKTGRLVVPVDHVAKTGAGYYLICDPQKADIYPLKQFRQWIRSS